MKVDGYSHSQVRWRIIRSHDKPRLMGVAPSTFQVVYIYIFTLTILYLFLWQVIEGSFYGRLVRCLGYTVVRVVFRVDRFSYRFRL